MFWKALPALPALNHLTPRAKRAALIAGIAAALIFAALAIVPALMGADNPPASAAQAVPAGATRVGTVALTLPESLGPWAQQDVAANAALAEASTAAGNPATSIDGYTSPSGVTITSAVTPSTGADPLAAVDAALAQLPGLTRLTWIGDLPSRAVEVEHEGVKTIAVYLALPDGQLVAVKATGAADHFTSGALASAVLSTVYTG